MTVAPIGTAPQTADHFCFVVHDLIPYCYDLNAILALPAGFRYRNRFDSPWVEPNLRGDTDAMTNREVLIVLRDHTQNRLIPTRWARIVLAQRVGKIYYFEYILGSLIQYSEDPVTREAEITQRTALLAQFHNWLPGTQGSPLSDMQPSVFRSLAGRQFPTTPDTNLTEWGNTVAAVTTSAAYHRVEFLRIVGLTELSGKEAPIVEEHFLVRPSRVYQLRVFQTIPVPDTAPVTPHDVDVITFSDHFVLLRSKQRAVGKYDMLNFVLKTKRLPPNERSAIEIPHTPHHNQGNYAPTALYMPVLSEGRSPAVVAAWTASVVTSLLLIFQPQLTHLDPTVTRNLATVVFVLLASGWANTLNALFPSLPWSK